MKKRKIKAERRMAQRLRRPPWISCKLMKRKNSERWVAHKDISGKGVGLLTDKPLKVNEKVKILIYTKDASRKPIGISCMVIWCRKRKNGKFGVGLEFVKVKDSARFTKLLCEKILDLFLNQN